MAITAAALIILVGAGRSTWALAAEASRVTTVAGSGLSGNADGPAAGASFTEPFGIAVAKNGTIYVSDIGGQRVRAIHGGVVSTVAGGGAPSPGSDRVSGGYRDGKAGEARFNRPMGLALLSDGTLLVADGWNHCIRAIRRGVVSTFAGNAERSGSQDGPLKDATFMEPRALAVDDAGTIFVADRGINGSGGGLRKITPDGIVSTVTLPSAVKPTIVAAAIAKGDRESGLYLSNLEGLVELDPMASAHAVKYGDIAEGSRPFGYPDSLLTVRDAVVFTDARTHAVRLFRRPIVAGGSAASQPLNAPRPLDASDNGGGFRDGTMDGALFDSPRGIARDSNGDLIICDSGNRRVRRIQSPDVRVPLIVPPRRLPQNQMLALGGSPLFFDTLWASSIPGRLENALAQPIEALQYDETSKSDIARDIHAVARSGAKSLLWMLSTRELDALGEEGLRSELAEFGRSSPRPIVALLPFAGELGGTMQFAALAMRDPQIDESKDRAHYAVLRKIVTQSGIRSVDLSEPLLRYIATDERGAPYAGLSPYLTNVGREVVVRSLAAGLRRR